MLIAYVPLLVAVVGVLVYVLASNGKAQEIGRAMLWSGILVTLFVEAGHVVHIGS